MQGKLAHDPLSWICQLSIPWLTCTQIVEACMMHSVFDESPVNDVVTRSTMIAEYAEKGNYLSSFSNAPEEDGIRLLIFQHLTFLNTLKMFLTGSLRKDHS